MPGYYRYLVRGRTGDLALLWRPGEGDAPDGFALDGEGRVLAFADESSLLAHCRRNGLDLEPDGDAELHLVELRELLHRPSLDPAVAGQLLDAWNFFADLADSLRAGAGAGVELLTEGELHRSAYRKLFEGSALGPDECDAVRELLNAGLALWRSVAAAGVGRAG